MKRYSVLTIETAQYKNHGFSGASRRNFDNYEAALNEVNYTNPVARKFNILYVKAIKDNTTKEIIFIRNEENEI